MAGCRSVFFRYATALLLSCLAVTTTPHLSAGSERRFTDEVRAVERAKPAVVNVFGEKTIHDPEHFNRDDRRVNGMGTGVILDPRGLILTNHHVVQGVRKIQVTLANEETFTARLVAFDSTTDLAVIKIDARRSLPVIPVGRSDDLMPAETVLAVGNAFGYGHTVTKGIISALHRTVQVSETQQYEDLIQTDASINPGNSGGPLLNIDGEMIAINVAVRAGAQGIGFAIPSDRAMQVAARLISTRELQNAWHGLTLSERVSHSQRELIVQRVAKDSPAEAAGLKPGDRIEHVAGTDVARRFDLERALWKRSAGDSVAMTISRGGARQEMTLVLKTAPASSKDSQDRCWKIVGLRVESIPTNEFRSQGHRYRGGLRVVEVRGGSPAQRRGILPGDVLVGMHVWETVSIENLRYVLDRIDDKDLDPLKFYILRDNETLYGFLPIGDTRLR